ncbi:LysR family transcriptional regulator [Nonomuraea sp. NPDC005983]|uniref:LysR family transcriptional regulator n=1 Tax=Nonomuraea sp. NPDC005983 TaxID=3155595 RepID=UPI0033B8536C
MLDVRRLRLLRELAVHQTVAATAQALHLTGPAVSQQLAALAREAGVPLLEKEGRTLRLTAAGRRLVEHAEVILGSLAAVDADVAAWRSGHTGTVTVAVFPSAGRVLLPRLWARLQADPDFPQQLRIVEGEPEAALEVLRSGRADVAVVYSYTLAPPEVPDGCAITRLADDPVVLALHPDEAARRGLAQDRPVDLRDLHDAQWLLPSPPATCHELIRQACGAAGFVPDPLAVATDAACGPAGASAAPISECP